MYCFAISSFEDNLRAFLDKANYLCDKACTNTEAMENPRKIQNVNRAIFPEVFMFVFINGRFPIRRCGRGSISSSVLLPVAVSIRSRGFSHGLSRLRACNQFIGWRSVRVLSRNGSRGRRLPIRGRGLGRVDLGVRSFPCYCGKNFLKKAYMVDSFANFGCLVTVTNSSPLWCTYWKYADTDLVSNVPLLSDVSTIQAFAKLRTNSVAESVSALNWRRIIRRGKLREV